MTTNSIVYYLSNKQNGSFFNIEYTSDIPTTAVAKRNGTIVHKVTTATVRKGISYTAQKSVQMKVERGEINLTHELPWGQWKEGYKGLIIEHKGHDYVRLYTSPNKSKSKYYINGKEVSYEDLKLSGVVLNSWFNKPSSKPDALTVKTESITKIY